MPWIVMAVALAAITALITSHDPPGALADTPSSSDASLSALSLSGIDIGTFDPATTTYSTSVLNRVGETTVMATTSHSGASYVIKVGGVEHDGRVIGGVEDDDGVVTLRFGKNILTVEVTAEDGKTTQTYVVEVVRVWNTPATGTPVINGTVEVGETLTVDLSGIADEDGIDLDGMRGGATYQYGWWAKGGRCIIGMGVIWIYDDPNSPFYPELGSEQTSFEVPVTAVGRSISMEVWFMDEAGNREILSSAPMPVLPGPVVSLTLVDTSDQSDVAELECVHPQLPGHVITLEDPAEGSYSIRADMATTTGVGSISWNLQRGAFWRNDETAPYSLYGEDEKGNLLGRGLAVGKYTLGVAVYHKDVGYLQSVYADFEIRSSASSTPPPDVPESPELTVPGAPRSVEVEPGGTGELDVSWQEPASNGGSPITSYTVQWKESSDSWDSSIDVSATTTSETSYTITGLSLGTEYTVRVIATTEAGDGPASTEVRETADAQISQQQGASQNTPATGAPTISGTPEVGQTLFAETSGINDADGRANATFTYQWIRSDEATDTDIAGATGSTYTLVSDDEDKTVKVRVSFTDDAGNDESLTSVATAAVEAALTAELQGVPSSHSGSGTFTFRILFSEDVSVGFAALKQHAFEVSNATIKRAQRVNGRNDLRKFTIQPSSDTAVVLVLPATEDCDNEGAICTSDRKRLSTRLEIIVPGPANTAATGVPTISGTLEVGQTLSGSTSGINDADGLSNVSFSHQWIANYGATDTDIQGATASTYTLTESDEGKTIKVRVSFTDDRDNEETLTSSATAAVSAPPTPNNPSTGAPAITGTAQVGETLTASTSGISDEDGTENAVFAHQWIAYDGTTDTDIQGANASTYTLTNADQGRTIQVRVSFTDDAGNDESLTSAATAAVEARPNSPATGAPAITGTAQVGETLTPDTSDISDSDGMDDVSFSYSWLADDADIAGATGNTYTLADSDEGKAIRVQVSFTDDRGNDETLTSEATEAVEPSDQQEQTPEPTDRPHGLQAIIEAGTVVLSWNAPDAAGNVSMYRILRHRPEEGETEPLVYVDYTLSRATSYTDTDVEPGTLYTYSVKAADFFGLLEEASYSASVRVPGSNSPATGAPVIGGTAQVGETLTADTSGISDEDGLDNVSFAHQWLADDAEIHGATDSTYTLTDAQEGTVIKVRVSFTDDGGNDETLTSTATGAVEARPNNPATGAPTITGTAQVDETLTVDTSGISDGDGLDDATISYQWLADDSDIVGAIGSTYTLVADDEGKTIKVRVSFADDRGNDETLTSTATASVAAATAQNSIATGAPTISGAAKVGHALTADATGISDQDGTDNATFTYQWLADKTPITGATDATYLLTVAEKQKTITVTVSFTDDLGNDESVTSAATVAVTTDPLTVSVENEPNAHDGQSDFTFELRFSEQFGMSYETLKNHAFTVVGGSVQNVQRLDPDSITHNVRWEITVRPDGNGDVTITLPETTDCDSEGAICTGDRRMLSNRTELTAPGPGG